MVKLLLTSPICTGTFWNSKTKWKMSLMILVCHILKNDCFIFELIVLQQTQNLCQSPHLYCEVGYRLEKYREKGSQKKLDNIKMCGLITLLAKVPWPCLWKMYHMIKSSVCTATWAWCFQMYLLWKEFWKTSIFCVWPCWLSADG